MQSIKIIGGPLTMAQLEYNLPILIFGPTPTPQTIASTTPSKSNTSVSKVSIFTKISFAHDGPSFQLGLN